MAYAIGIVVLIVGLLISIGLHELGHMIPAKRFGVRVPRYMIGFGPTLWSRTVGETEYGLKAIPLGGYVRMVGMLPPAEAVGAQRRNGAVAQMIQEARDASAEEIPPGEEHRAFYRLSTPKKLIVMAGGTLANLLLAVVLLAVVLMGFGIFTGAATTTVGMTLPCVLPVDAPLDRECTETDQPTPAAAAGLEIGDVLLSYGGVPVGTWEDFVAAVQQVDGGDIPLVVERDGRELTLSVSPIVTERPVWDADGNAVLDEDGEVVTAPARYVGLSPTSARERQTFSETLPIIGQVVGETLDTIVHLPWRLADIGASLVDGGEREAGVIGLVGVGQMAGEIASSETPGQEVSGRVAGMLSLVASLNVALFAFNLIPLLPLDGGHVAGALWEGAKRVWARWRGRPRPAPADMARMMPLAYGVFVFMAGMTIFLIVADVLRPVTG